MLGDRRFFQPVEGGVVALWRSLIRHYCNGLRGRVRMVGNLLGGVTATVGAGGLSTSSTRTGKPSRNE